jgi:hypothetical protein
MPSTITKAQLETTVAELQAALADAEQRVIDLQQQAEAPSQDSPERRNQLEQTVWIQREAPSHERGTMKWSADGETLIIRVAAQYATLDRRSGQRLFGERRWYTAFGVMAEQILDLYRDSDTRLVRIGAYERPQAPAQDGTRRSEWILASFEPMPRTDTPAQSTTPASEEEVPF